MQRIISLLLIGLLLALPPAMMAQEAVVDDSTSTLHESARLEGRQYASKHYQGWRWFGAGFAGGLALGLIGAAVTLGFSQTGTAVPPKTELARLEAESQTYADGFKLGYHQKARSKALGKCILGSLAGIGTIIVIFAVSHIETK